MVTKNPIIGVDFGQSKDYSAISYGIYGGLQKISSEDNSKPPHHEPFIEIRYLERLQLGVKYEDQITRLKKVYDKVKSVSGKTPILVVDGTGVGKAVVEMVRKGGMSPIVVTVTGGQTVTKDGRNWNIPKKELVSPAIVGIQNGTVRIANSLEHAEVLKKEMQNFKLKINIATGNESFEAWRERDHDDLVFATSLVVYAFKNMDGGGVFGFSNLPSKYAEGMGNWNKYQ